MLLVTIVNYRKVRKGKTLSISSSVKGIIQLQFVKYYSATRLTVATQQTFAFDNYVHVNTSTQQSMQRC